MKLALIAFALFSTFPSFASAESRAASDAKCEKAVRSYFAREMPEYEITWFAAQAESFGQQDQYIVRSTTKDFSRYTWLVITSPAWLNAVNECEIKAVTLADLSTES